MIKRNVLSTLAMTICTFVSYGQSSQSATEHYNKAAEYFNSKNYGLAIASYSACIEQDPANVKAYYNRGNAALNLQQTEAAITDFEKAVSLDPVYAKGHLSLGYARLINNQFDQAIVSLTKATELDPSLTKAFVQRGTAFMKKGDYTAAGESTAPPPFLTTCGTRSPNLTRTLNGA